MFILSPLEVSPVSRSASYLHYQLPLDFVLAVAEIQDPHRLLSLTDMNYKYSIMLI